jgi:alkyl hydroperoxide reductase subunit F
MDIPGFTLDMGALKKARAPEPETTYDLLVLGGGPASMSAAIYAARKMLKLAVITKDFGGQMLETSDIENWLGYQSIDAKKLASGFEDHVKSFDLPVSLGPAVMKVEKLGEVFKVGLDNGKTYSGRAVIYSTGMRHRPLKGVAYCATCDAPLFKNKKVVVAGGGNSAFTTAVDLIKVEAKITMVNFIKGWNADESLQKRVGGHETARLLDNHEVLKIEGQDRVEAVVIRDLESGEEERIEADGVFIEIGLISNVDPVRGLVGLNHRGEIEVDCTCRTSVDGMFAAGDVTNVPFKQIIIAAGEGAKAALAAYDYLVDKEWI